MKIIGVRTYSDVSLEKAVLALGESLGYNKENREVEINTGKDYWGVRFVEDGRIEWFVSEPDRRFYSHLTTLDVRFTNLINIKKALEQLITKSIVITLRGVPIEVWPNEKIRIGKDEFSKTEIKQIISIYSEEAGHHCPE